MWHWMCGSTKNNTYLYMVNHGGGDGGRDRTVTATAAVPFIGSTAAVMLQDLSRF